MKISQFDTKLGTMVAIADEDALYLLEFVDGKGVEREIEKLKKTTKSVITSGYTPPIRSIKKEITQYFEGHLTEFKTPLALVGSPFQKSVWNALKKIPYGQTCSYSDIAQDIKKATAYRAVANANGANQLAIVIPCHRVINLNGDWGGYGGGLPRKKWLIKHEQGIQC